MKLICVCTIACASWLSLSSAQLPDPLGGLGFGLASARSEIQPNSSKLTAALQASRSSYKQGESLYLAYTLDVEKPWHAYYRNPATVGLPLEFSIEAPSGFELKGPYWSIPHRMEGATGVSYGYSQALAIWQLTPKGDAPAEASFKVSSVAQLCNDEGCLPPETSSASLSLKLGDGSANAEWKSQESEVETLGESDVELQASKQGPHSIVLQFSAAAGDVKSAYFFSEDNFVAPQLAQELIADKDGVYQLVLPINDGSNPLYPAPKTPSANLRGLLVFDDSHVSVDIPLLAEPATVAVAGIPSGFWTVVASLFLGGFILNLMPCVFPVIGLKIMSFVEMAGGDRRKVLMHAGAFVLGVVVSFWILTLGIIIASKIDMLLQLPWSQWASAIWNDGGSSTRSWAVWMQNPWVVYILSLILLILGLSMYGIFEIGVSATGAGQNLQNKKGLSGSFFSGLLATVVATPCSGPFLGAALPVAMAMPSLWLMLAMTCMALGLALPYILIAAFPSLLRFLPRPGAWMESLKQGLSFLIFLAVAWLVGVYITFIPEQNNVQMLWMLIGMVLISSAFWVYGRWCPIFRSKLSRISGLIVMMALLVVGVVYSNPSTVLNVKQDWVTWTPTAMEEALDDGYPVYVDYTASWCATCLLNKEVAYSDDVYALMEDAGVILMRADKTAPNAAIDAELTLLGRSSVPVNVLYIPDEKPAITKELLTASYLKEFLLQHLKTYLVN